MSPSPNVLRLEKLKDLREALTEYLYMKEEVWILFDNLDKGWSSFGISQEDVLILRCLLDANRKIQRELQRREIVFHSVVFVRDDVYRLLVRTSADFGKEMQASLDWSDGDLLREMLRRRISAAEKGSERSFEEVWAGVCVPLYDGEEVSQYFIDRSLMRPRNLLKIFTYCRGFAVNLGHERIESEDIEKGLKAFSNDLLVDADRELSDLEPSAEGLIYQFIGEASSYSPEELDVFFARNNVKEENISIIGDYLLYYGFIGIKQPQQDTRYIYDVSYNMTVLKTIIEKNLDSIRFVLNRAFWPALGIAEPGG